MSGVSPAGSPRASRNRLNTIRFKDALGANRVEGSTLGSPVPGWGARADEVQVPVARVSVVGAEVGHGGTIGLSASLILLRDNSQRLPPGRSWRNCKPPLERLLLRVRFAFSYSKKERAPAEAGSRFSRSVADFSALVLSLA